MNFRFEPFGMFTRARKDRGELLNLIKEAKQNGEFSKEWKKKFA